MLKKRIMIFICASILLSFPILGVAESINQEQSVSSTEMIEELEVNSEDLVVE